MEPCWEADPSQRPSSKDVVLSLRTLNASNSLAITYFAEDVQDTTVLETESTYMHWQMSTVTLPALDSTVTIRGVSGHTDNPSRTNIPYSRGQIFNNGGDATMHITSGFLSQSDLDGNFTDSESSSLSASDDEEYFDSHAPPDEETPTTAE